jgi:hypothetical protein
MEAARADADQVRQTIVQAEGIFEKKLAVCRALEIELTALESALAPVKRKVKDPKSTAPSAKPRSSRNKEPKDITPSTEGSSDSAGVVCAVPNCGKPENAPVHDVDNPLGEYHVFHAEIKKKAATA